MPTVLLLASLDTRGKEAVYLRTLIEGLGCKVILTDISMRKHDQAGADYTCADVASEGGASFEQISSHKGTSEIITPMIKGSVKIARKLFETGSIDAIAGFGGASNTLFVSSVMGSLPFGLPKLILSSSAAIPAYAARYFAFKDIAIFHACVDINGLNAFVKDQMRRFAAMIAGVSGMVKVAEEEVGKRVAVTEYQFSETCAQRVRNLCASRGFETIPFHAQGVGDQIMEEMIVDGVFDAVIDLVPAGLSEAILGGNRAAGLERLDRELTQGIPVILTPCGFDMLSCGPYERRHKDPLWKKKGLAKRKLYIQDELRVQARTTKREMELFGRVLAEKLNHAASPVAFFIPLKGFSSLGVDGGPLNDPEADGAFVKSLKRHLNGSTEGRLELIEMDCSIDDQIFADSIVDRLSAVLEVQGLGISPAAR